MRRSWERMKNLEGKLRAGMTANGIDMATQENIVQNISSFALYGFLLPFALRCSLDFRSPGSPKDTANPA
jgi:hypothetical protein